MIAQARMRGNAFARTGSVQSMHRNVQSSFAASMM